MSQENFMVNVQFCPGQPQPENVDVNPSSGTTTIVDADGKLHECYDWDDVLFFCMMGVLCGPKGPGVPISNAQ